MQRNKINSFKMVISVTINSVFWLSCWMV